MPKAYVRNNFTLSTYLQALDQEEKVYAKFQQIRAKDLKVVTQTTMKTALSIQDNKKFYKCALHSVPYESIYAWLPYCRHCLLDAERKLERQECERHYKQALRDGHSTAEASEKAIAFAYDLAAANDLSFRKREEEALRVAIAAESSGAFPPKYRYLCDRHKVPFFASIYGKFARCPFCITEKQEKENGKRSKQTRRRASSGSSGATKQHAAAAVVGGHASRRSQSCPPSSSRFAAIRDRTGRQADGKQNSFKQNKTTLKRHRSSTDLMNMECKRPRAAAIASLKGEDYSDDDSDDEEMPELI